jgi:hypothetical protein
MISNISHPRILLSMALGLAVAPMTQAKTLLFEDDFQVLDKSALLDPESRKDINREATTRQTGSLAPTQYSSNGAPWQQQLYAGPGYLGAQGGVLRLFPMAHRDLIVSPGWNLKEEAGVYSLDLWIRKAQADALPARIFVALGASSGPLNEGTPDVLGGALVLQALMDPEPTLQLIQDGAEVSSAVPCPNFAAGGDLAIRWKQNGPLEISNIEVECDGITILRHEGSVSVGGGNVGFGARIASGQGDRQGFGILVIDVFRYTQE